MTLEISMILANTLASLKVNTPALIELTFAVLALHNAWTTKYFAYRAAVIHLAIPTILGSLVMVDALVRLGVEW